MYHRPHHRRIATILNALDADLFLEKSCFFGGGTAIALQHGEFRESRDVDFLVSDHTSFLDLRELVKKDGPRQLFAQPDAVELPAPFFHDEYGIRGWVSVDKIPIKFEVVAEGRISLDIPGPDDYIGPIATLTRSNMVAEKLLANSDRYADSSTFHRDLIDLAFLGLGPVRQTLGFYQANQAYGDAIARDLNNSAARILENPTWLQRCLTALSITTDQHEVVTLIRRLVGQEG